MANFLTPPTTNLPNFYEKSKFALTWRIALMFSSVIICLSIVTFFMDDRFFYYYLSVLSVTIGGLFYLNYSKSYALVAKIMLLGTATVIIFSVVLVGDAIHIIEALWMTVIILTAFFTLGRLWGVFFLIISSLLFSYYFMFLFSNTIHDRIVVSQKHDIMMTIEFTFAMFLIGYIMYQFAIVNSYAKKKSALAFKELEQEKGIVERQNHEKTVLLQEIHHRVKNNLQVIISLLRIQSSELKSKETIQSFDDAINRILTMSLIHQKMYQKESLVNINISDYLNTLIEDLIKTNSTKVKVDYKIKSSIESIGAKSIVPLGLIINELVSNSIKHAFEEAGTISIEIESIENSKLRLNYSDNGTWKENKDSSFGLQLIEVFTDQLEGKFERSVTEAGTHYLFEFANLDE
jgi:two-component sensor histidine kinase